MLSEKVDLNTEPGKGILVCASKQLINKGREPIKRPMARPETSWTPPRTRFGYFRKTSGTHEMGNKLQSLASRSPRSRIQHVNDSGKTCHGRSATACRAAE